MRVYTDRAHLLTRANYPGMIPAESRLLRQFILKHGLPFDEWRFGVRIGEGVQLDDQFAVGVRKAWEAITKARPDTVAMRGSSDATIIEVKEAWSNEAVWQLLSYRDLYAQTFPDHTVRLVGVAAFATPTARELTRRQPIALHLYTNLPDQVDVAELGEETNGTDHP